jgi:hypothetical protein
LADCHEELWTSFEQGQFKLKPGDGDSVGVEVAPCRGDDERRLAKEQNGSLVSYRQRLIEEAVRAAREPVERRKVQAGVFKNHIEVLGVAFACREGHDRMKPVTFRAFG